MTDNGQKIGAMLVNADGSTDYVADERGATPRLGETSVPHAHRTGLPDSQNASDICVNTTALQDGQ